MATARAFVLLTPCELFQSSSSSHLFFPHSVALGWHLQPRSAQVTTLQSRGVNTTARGNLIYIDAVLPVSFRLTKTQRFAGVDPGAIQKIAGTHQPASLQLKFNYLQRSVFTTLNAQTVTAGLHHPARRGGL